jgi:ribose 5-phosphate isomerase A
MVLKKKAAEYALNFVHSGMILGLGTGSTTAHFITLLGERLQAGELTGILAVPTSQETEKRARSLGIPLTNLSEHPHLDLAVDGADEVDPDLNLIKGLGRALLREKIVEIHAGRFVVIVTDDKLVPRLGSLGPLPIEIVPFEAAAQIRWLNTLGCLAEIWYEEDGRPAITDNGNQLALLRFHDGIDDPYGLARKLADRPGIVEHGLFLDMASQVVVAAEKEIRLLERKP